MCSKADLAETLGNSCRTSHSFSVLLADVDWFLFGYLADLAKDLAVTGAWHTCNAFDQQCMVVQ